MIIENDVQQVDGAYSVAMLPEKPEPATFRIPSAWANIPKLYCFSEGNSDNFFIPARLMAAVAHRDETLYALMDCRKFIPGKFTFIADYNGGWQPDNAMEMHIRTARTHHQFYVNARRAFAYWRGGVACEKPDSVNVSGQYDAEHWLLQLEVPFAVLEIDKRERIAMRLCCYMPDLISSTQYYELHDGRMGKPYWELEFKPEMSRAECRRYEKAINRDHQRFLSGFPANTFIPGLVSRAKSKGWNIGRLAKCGGVNLSVHKRADEYAEFISGYYQFYRDLLPRLFSGPLRVDLSKSIGGMRNINGTNMGPMLVNQAISNFNDDFRALRFIYMRTHDIPLDNPGLRICDTGMVFPNFHADPGDARNYYFRPTDDYLVNTLDQGTGIIYRLGASIEHSLKKYAAAAPPDNERFAEICAGIIRHYNHGWAAGFKLGIRYWEIWNEPDIGPKMWDKDMAAFYEMYAVTARRLKREFPDILIGGPALTHLNVPLCSEFLSFCGKRQAPVDFFSWHKYGKSLDEFTLEPYRARLLLDSLGYERTELHLNEWHYLPCPDYHSLPPDKKKDFHTSDDGICGIDSAAFNVAVISRWQDSPLDLSCYYATGLASYGWGLSDPYGNLNKNYYSFLALGEILASCSRRLDAGSGRKHVTILAGANDHGGAVVLISSFRGREKQLAVKLKNMDGKSTIKIRRLDFRSDLEKTDSVWLNDTLILNKAPGSAVFIINIDPLQLEQRQKRKAQ